MHFTYPKASLKDVQATGEAFIHPSKIKTFTPSKMKFVNFFLFLWVTFALLDSDLIRICNTAGKPEFYANPY